MRLKLLTLNAGLLRVKFWGRTLNEPAPYVAERFPLMKEGLKQRTADLLLLQEVYEDGQRENLVHELLPRYPYFVAIGHEQTWALNNGLMLFSRYPIEDALFVPFEKGLFEEKLTSEKGFLLAVLRTPIGQLAVFNLHAVSGGIFLDPERDDVNEVRGRQFEQLLHGARHLGIPSILAGDFNAGPGVSSSNYRTLLQAGLTDAYAAGAEDASGITWDPTNPLNSNGPHGRMPPQRIDHVFLDRRLMEQTHDISARIIFRDKLKVKAGVETTLSDHFGLEVDLEFSG